MPAETLTPPQKAEIRRELAAIAADVRAMEVRVEALEAQRAATRENAPPAIQALAAKLEEGERDD